MREFTKLFRSFVQSWTHAHLMSLRFQSWKCLHTFSPRHGGKAGPFAALSYAHHCPPAILSTDHPVRASRQLPAVMEKDGTSASNSPDEPHKRTLDKQAGTKGATRTGPSPWRASPDPTPGGGGVRAAVPFVRPVAGEGLCSGPLSSSGRRLHSMFTFLRASSDTFMVCELPGL